MTKKTLRRMFTASMASALTISLASCSAAKANVGKIPSETYATAGNYSVSCQEIWDELKWNSADVLNEQIQNVILNKYITAIETVVANNTLQNADEALLTVLGFNDENPYSDAAYKKVKKRYEDRLVDYVVQDIYDYSFRNDEYWILFDDKEHSTLDLLEAQYVDEIYSEYRVTVDISTLKNADYKDYDEKYDTYLDLANTLASKYYPLLAKELLAYAKLDEDILEAEEEDDDDDDTVWGYFNTSDYVSKFENEYTNNYDLKAVIVDFVGSDEINETLRAFGIKIYNKKLYYIYDSQDEDKYTLTTVGGKKYMNYEDYIEYFDDFDSSKLSSGNPRNEKGEILWTRISDEAVLELYIQIYNYMYGGYKDTLATNYDYSSYNELNDLRKISDEVLKEYATDGTTKLKQTIDGLLLNNTDMISFTAEELTQNRGSAFKNYIYNSLDPLNDTDESGNAKTNITKCYSTSGQSSTLGETLVYLISEDTTKVDGETVDDTHSSWYNDDRSTDEILDYITREEYKDLFLDIKQYLKQDKITESFIDEKYDEVVSDAEIKIYNDACEIAYSSKNSDYSKALKKNKNSNVLATIKYDNKTWNVNITADASDENGTVVPGTHDAFGVYNYLEEKDGATVASDLLYKKMIKSTKTYTDLLEDKDQRELYENYIENLLINFSNDYLSSSGYSSSLGKYNFLMLYYHTANITDIINNVYFVSYASSKLLTDYSSDNVVNFMMTYTAKAEENYFSLGGKRLVVYMDIDGDGNADEDFDWTQTIKDVNSPLYNGGAGTYETAAKELLYVMYTKISASPDAHDTKASSLVTEYSGTAKANYSSNPISAEQIWAKYRHLGLNVKLVDFSVTNSSLDCDFDLKQRLYDYSRGTNEDGSITYEYFIKDSTPTCYIEPIDADAKLATDNTLVQTKDGFNLIMVTSGTSTASAKFEAKDHDEEILENIILKYRNENVKIENIYNDTDNLNFNQIKFYLVDYAINGGATMTPSSISTSYSTFLQPLVSRFTGTETQRIVQINYMAKETGAADFYTVIQFNTAANTSTWNKDSFKNLLEINQRVADSYPDIYDDTTGTSDIYSDTDASGNKITWWDGILNLLGGK